MKEENACRKVKGNGSKGLCICTQSPTCEVQTLIHRDHYTGIDLVTNSRWNVSPRCTVACGWYSRAGGACSQGMRPCSMLMVTEIREEHLLILNHRRGGHRLKGFTVLFLPPSRDWITIVSQDCEDCCPDSCDLLN